MLAEDKWGEPYGISHVEVDEKGRKTMLQANHHVGIHKINNYHYQDKCSENH